MEQLEYILTCSGEKITGTFFMDQLDDFMNIYKKVVKDWLTIVEDTKVYLQDNLIGINATGMKGLLKGVDKEKADKLGYTEAIKQMSEEEKEKSGMELYDVTVKIEIIFGRLSNAEEYYNKIKDLKL